METKEPIKIKLSTVILLFIILMLILIIALLILSKNNIKNQSSLNTTNNMQSQSNLNITNNIQNVVSKNREAELEKISLDINSEHIKKLYNYIPVVDENKIERNAYQSKKVISNNLSNEYKLMYAFKNLDLKETDKQPFSTEMDLSTGWYSFDANILQNKIKEIFGDNSNVSNANFEIGYGAECSYSNGKYSYSVGGGSGEYIQNIRKIQEAYQENDIIYIIDKYMILQSNEEKNVLYADSDSTQLITEVEDIVAQKDEKEILKELINNYYESMKEYKHTFKKNIDGTYYWYSTEPMKLN